jgi:hypothetical protein
MNILKSQLKEHKIRTHANLISYWMLQDMQIATLFLKTE